MNTTLPITPYVCRCGGVITGILVGPDVPKAKAGRSAICGACLFVSVFQKDLSLTPATQVQLAGFLMQEPFLKNLLTLEKLRGWRVHG